jgi:hypothetical protein
VNWSRAVSTPVAVTDRRVPQTQRVDRERGARLGGEKRGDRLGGRGQCGPAPAPRATIQTVPADAVCTYQYITADLAAALIAYLR